MFPSETTAEIAAREFSEETSCLFYLKEQINDENKTFYELLKDNKNLFYEDTTIDILKTLIPLSQKYYTNKITEFVLPLYVSSKETYISYLLKVNYLNENDLPHAEDIHINYEERYLRECRWFSYDELMELDDKDFHKRLQITRIKQRIKNYYEKNLF
ncbi:MAG: hydrolase [Satyrvirus sp.]|uniref:Hydrolase n=1 Tax=Satyrvirus sp. TaxID=2487771 RepID=A0A3G5AE00_9VIRU|nr:MAG: hydrolase [Satyrvirus sp.]